METKIQRIDVKVFADVPEKLDLDPLLVIFDRWRRDPSHPADWIDLADYAHMSKGPGIMMVGKQGSISFNSNDPGPGMLYSGRRDFEGSLEDRLVEAFRRCAGQTADLLGEPEFQTGIALRTGDWLVALNDRMEFPNDSASDEAVRPSLMGALDRVFGGADVKISRGEDSQGRLSYRIVVAGAPGLNELVERLAAAAPST